MDLVHAAGQGFGHPKDPIEIPRSLGAAGGAWRWSQKPKRGAEREPRALPETWTRSRWERASKSPEIASPGRRVGLGWVASLCAMMDEKLVRFVLAPRNCFEFGRSQRALAGCGNRATAAPHYCALCIETLAAGQGGPTRLG